MPEILRIFWGIGLVAIIHCLVFIICSIILGSLINTPMASMAASIAIFGIFCIGFAQVLYIIPLIIYLVNRKASGLVKGVIIGALLTALINGVCWVFLYTASE